MSADDARRLAVARDEGPEPDGPPWPLTPSEIQAFSTDGLTARSFTRLDGRRVAEFGRQPLVAAGKPGR